MKSSNLHISPRRRIFTRFLGIIQHAILEALDEEHKNRGLTRAEMARILGTNKGFITKKLNGTSNMTIETIADLAFALDRDPDFSLTPRSAAAGANRASATVQAATTPTPSVVPGANQVLAAA
jgi:transcriptional regulator with XRE-family HTH domain